MQQLALLHWHALYRVEPDDVDPDEATIEAPLPAPLTQFISAAVAAAARSRV